MLSGSALAGLSFLSKAARHSFGFTKSSEDETNPVALLCEHGMLFHPPSLPQPSSHWCSFSLYFLQHRWRATGRKLVSEFEALSIGNWFQFNAPMWRRKNQFKVVESHRSPGWVSSKNDQDEEDREIKIPDKEIKTICNYGKAYKSSRIK